MIIKPFSGRTADLAELEALTTRADVLPAIQAEIDRQITIIRAGEHGEREAAYEIDFHHGPSRNWAVIHDLRIEHDGRVAQMDHLVIGRFLDIYVCETKHFSSGVSINEHGEFTRFFNNRPQPIPSPIEQNRKHLRVLDSILRSDKIVLPKRLGLSLRPLLHSVVLISQRARITRPEAAVDGIETVIKSDQLRTLIEKDIDQESFTSALRTAGKLIASDTLEDLASQIARLHRPLRTDWPARFGLPNEEVRSPSLSFSTPAAKHLDAVEPPLSSVPVIAVKPDLISTSKLGTAWGLPNVHATLEHLQVMGLVRMVGEEAKLTDAGIGAGGQFVAKSRFGPYFLWPRDLRR